MERAVVVGTPQWRAVCDHAQLSEPLHVARMDDGVVADGGRAVPRPWRRCTASMASKTTRAEPSPSMWTCMSKPASCVSSTWRSM
jgi:hypothetical protein